MRTTSREPSGSLLFKFKAEGTLWNRELLVNAYPKASDAFLDRKHSHQQCAVVHEGNVNLKLETAQKVK